MGPSSDPTKSASLAQAEREIKALKEENLALKKEAAEIRSAYKQLITESTHENYDERRVNFLKAQMIQLERQILILNEALSSRSNVLVEVESSLSSIVALCRHYLNQNDKIGEVAVSKDDLLYLVQNAESAICRLNKNSENTNPEHTEKHVIMLQRFLRPHPQKAVTLLDICSGNLEHINLKHVAKLESKLSQLYRQLMLIGQTLHTVIRPSDSSFQQEKLYYESANHRKAEANRSTITEPSPHDLPHCVYARLGTQVAKACNMLKDVTEDLLALSILIPSAPWPPLKKPLLKELTTDAVMSKITGMSKSKQTVVRNVVDSLIKAINYKSHMANIQAQVLKDEIAFHQEIYHLQIKYIDSLWNSLRIGYEEFQTNTDKLICQPMKEILNTYDTLQRTASEDALKYFLKVFKKHYVQMLEAVKNLSVYTEEKQGEEAISAYGEDFFQSLSKLKTEQENKRETLLNELDIAKQQFDDYMEELQKMFPELHHKDIHQSAGVSPCVEHSGRQVQEERKQSEEVKNTGRRTISYCTSPASGIHSKNCEVDVMTNVMCNCGAESDANKDHAVEDGVQCFDSDQRETVKHDNLQNTGDVNAVKEKAMVGSSRRLPRPVKGVPQSKLVLLNKKRNQADADSGSKQNGTCESEKDQDGSGKHVEMPSNISENVLDATHHGMLYQRSSSLSRIGQKNTRPSHLKPLVNLSSLLQSDYGSQTSKPWK